MTKSDKSKIDKFTAWMEKEVIVCREQNYLSKDGLYELLKSGARTFGIDQETASKLIIQKLEI